MLTLITGVPGHGKTLRAVGHVRRHLAEGRKVYSDIDDLNLDGVELAPSDWRDTPEGSVVVYDEAQRLFGSDGRGGGRSERDDIRAFETHRHTGHDIYLITQHPNLLHAHVRRLVGRHEHVSRIFGRNVANVRWQDRCWEVDKPSERAKAITETWSYPKADFGVYKSATIHTNTRRLPGFVKYGAVAVLALLGVVAWSFSKTTIFSGASPGIVSAEKPSPSVAVSPTVSSSSGPAREVLSHQVAWVDRDWAAAGTKTSVGGCISNDRRCQCYSVDGEPLDISQLQCHKRVLEPLPYSVDMHSPSTGGEKAPVSGAQRSAEPFAAGGVQS